MIKQPYLHLINEIKTKLGFSRALTATGDDAIDAINNLATEIADKASTANTYTKTETNTLLNNKKNVQSAISSPTASGNAIEFIDTISQNTQGVITPTKKIVRTMSGASSSSNGTSGLVPAPAQGNQEKFLKGDGTWATPPATDISGKIDKNIGTTAGDLIYFSGASTPARLAVGTNGKSLVVKNGIPTWDNVTVTSMTTAEIENACAYPTSGDIIFNTATLNITRSASAPSNANDGDIWIES